MPQGTCWFGDFSSHFKMTEHRNRLTSSTDYYPTISELLAAAPNELSIFTSKAKKSTLECLLRETLSQLNDCKKKLETSSGIISETAQAVKSIERKIVNIEPGALNHPGLSSSQHTNYSDAVKRTLDERDYDIKSEDYCSIQHCRSHVLPRWFYKM